MKFIYISSLVLGLIFSGCGGSNGVSKEEYEKSSQKKEKEEDKVKPTPTKKSYIGYGTDSPFIRSLNVSLSLIALIFSLSSTSSFNNSSLSLFVNFSSTH
jgi:hypothetical protein